MGLFACTLIQAQDALDPTGHWEGNIRLPATQLAIRLDFAAAPGGGWSGTIDIPVQGLRDFKLGPVTVEGSQVQFAMPNIPGDPAFAGRLDDTGKNLAGDFTQSGQTFPFAVERKPHPAAAAGEVPSRGIPGRGLAGHWMGSLKPTAVIELRLALELTNAAAGQVGGTLVSLDQGNVRIPLPAFAAEGTNVQFKVPMVSGSYDGVLSDAGSEIAGDWQQMGNKLPLVFKRVAEAPRLNRPQEPNRPYPYAEEEVRIETPTDGVTLGATFTRPRSAGPHPAVVLLTGSGPQDRDEAIMGHRPFLVLADHLTRRGIAVLRCDDRGVGKSTGSFSTAVHTDFVDDALAAVAWLKRRPSVDPKRIGLVGHSEGGLVAPLAAVKQPEDIAFLVLMAGVGVPTEDLLIRQGADIARVMGAGEDLIAKSAAAQRELFPALKAASSTAEAERLMRELVTRQMTEFTPEQRQAMGLTEPVIESQVKMASTPWFRKLLAYDPRPTLRRVRCPVLAINGEKDLQVAAVENLAAIRGALAAGGNAQVQTVSFPGLNHLFQTCTTGAVSEYGQIEETLNPTALGAIADWILRQP